jgi:hypothetical protein
VQRVIFMDMFPATHYVVQQPASSVQAMYPFYPLPSGAVVHQTHQQQQQQQQHHSVFFPAGPMAIQVLGLAIVPPPAEEPLWKQYLALEPTSVQMARGINFDEERRQLPPLSLASAPLTSQAAFAPLPPQQPPLSSSYLAMLSASAAAAGARSSSSSSSIPPHRQHSDVSTSAGTNTSTTHSFEVPSVTISSSRFFERTSTFPSK